MYLEKQLIEKLNKYRQLPVETEWLEFKEAKRDYAFEKMGQYFSALSNEANLKGRKCGWLIFGVMDKVPREIVGTHYRESLLSLESLKHEIAESSNGHTFTEIYQIVLHGSRVIMFQIPAAPAGIPTSWKGHYYGRNGESLVPLSPHKYECIRKQISQTDWTAELCPEASIDALDRRALIIARKRFEGKNVSARFGENIDEWDISTFLDKTKLARGGVLTKAAILLLGKEESCHFLLPHPAQITWKLIAEEQAYEHFGPPFLLNVEEIFKRIRNIKFKIQPFNQLIPVELSKYDPKIVLEALNNCIAHQDYSQNARVIITETTDKLVLQNIGSFYDGTVEEYVLEERTPEKYRNPWLAQAMVNLDMIDTMGMGIRRMFIEQRKRFFPLPEYDLDDRNHVKMTIFGKLIDENYSRILMEDLELSLNEVIWLDAIQKKRTITKDAALNLKKRGLVEGRYPKLFVSAKIAQTTGEKAEYTKHKAFDKQYYKDLVLNFLEHHGEASPSDIQRLLMEKLSDLLSDTQKKNKIRAIMHEMSKKDSSIQNNGARGNSANWSIKAS